MPMHAGGLTKLSEECGELVQAACKAAAMPPGQVRHWDGSYPKEALENEMADVLAAMRFVVEKREDLDVDRINERAARKLEQYHTWDKDPNN